MSTAVYGGGGRGRGVRKELLIHQLDHFKVQQAQMILLRTMLKLISEKNPTKNNEAW